MELEEWMLKLIGLTCAAIAAACKAPGTAGQELVQSALNVFAENILKPKYVADKSVIMVNVLMVLRLLLDFGNGNKTFRINGLSEDDKLYCFTKKTELATTPDLAGVVDVVLAMFKTLVVDLSLDTWMAWCEVSSANILHYKDCLLYWIDNEPPSNMQLLVAHLQAQCRQLLVEWTRLSTLVEEISTLMENLANFYDRKVEQLVEMMEQVQILDGWKQKAFVDHIAEEDLSILSKTNVTLSIWRKIQHY